MRRCCALEDDAGSLVRRRLGLHQSTHVARCMHTRSFRCGMQTGICTCFGALLFELDFFVNIALGLNGLAGLTGVS